MAVTAAENKLTEKNLDLIFEFEKYALEHPEIAEKIPRDAIVFLKLAGDEKFNRWSERKAKKQAKIRCSPDSVTGKKDETGSFSDRRTRLGARRLTIAPHASD
jgi:hypothetical protein